MPAPRPPRVLPAVALALALGGCALLDGSPPPLPRATLETATVFPADRSLVRPEDGVALADGSLLVADRDHGLRRVAPDGSSAPFGDLAAAGYEHDPPRRSSTANGVSLEPGGEHVLVADVVGGAIYRVHVVTGAAARVLDHEFGVNAAVRDSSGAIWFTQSARNTEEQGELGMFTPVDLPSRQGALYRLPFRGGAFAAEPEPVVSGLDYANGVVLDEERGRLYVSELGAGRVLAFPLDVAAGSLGERETLLEIATPDNLELDAHGRLWITSPLDNAVVVLDPDSGARHTAFQAQTPAQAELAREFERRHATATPRMELLTPALFEPLDGFLTGTILTADGHVFVSGLGGGLLRLDPPAE